MFVEDLGSPDAICEMCEIQEIRYVHHMQHSGYPDILEVGCVCAEKMEDDYEAPKRRERALRSAASRRKRWLSRTWKVSAQGNLYINTDGFNIAVFAKPGGDWGGRIQDRSTGQLVLSRRKYTTVDQAKLAAFDAMVYLKAKRGWGITR